ncbi:MAG: aminofutalosine synthase MqnE [Planctomycetes bacterium]|nr:aminofutalosine synthase MqnE [Planctomycetota bacterium]
MSQLLLHPDLSDIAVKVERGERLAFEDGVRLFRSSDIAGIGWLANQVRERLNGNRAYYIVNRHINYSNVCKNRCKFCAFSRDLGEPGAYTMHLAEVLKKAEEGVRQGATELHIVGGLHPELGLDYYLTMLSELSQRWPKVHLQAFTAVEVAHFADKAGLTVRETLRRLKDAGLGSLPGGGAEVFSTEVRAQLCPEKLSPEGWLGVMREAHQLGLRSNATMLYGHVETVEDRVRHILRLRELQDETRGFMTFIPLAFHPKHTDLEHERGPTAMDDLKTLAIGRLMLDNFPHVKAFWIMLGVKLAQVSLSFGVDDIDGTVVEERITHAAGAETPQCLSVGELLHLIREAGREPVERNTLYQRIHRPSGHIDANWALTDG